MIVEPLRDVPRRRIRAVAECYEQTPIRRDRDTASGLGAKPFRWHRRQGSKDDFRVAQRTLGYIEPSSRDVGITVRIVNIVEKREEDLVVRRKMRIKNHVEDANVLCGGRFQLGHTGYGLRQRTSGVQDAY